MQYLLFWAILPQARGTVVMGFQQRDNRRRPPSPSAMNRPAPWRPIHQEAPCPNPTCARGCRPAGSTAGRSRKVQVGVRGPVFAPLQRELQAITDAAWDAYDDSRKAPITRKAVPASPTRTTTSQSTG